MLATKDTGFVHDPKTGALVVTGLRDGPFLFDDDFSDGYCGWQDHMSGTTPQAPLSLTGMAGINGGGALKLSTGPKRSTVNSANCTALKRLSRPKESGILHFDCWWAVGGEDLTSQPAQVSFGIDTQLFDDSARGYAKLRYRRFDNTSQARINQWSVVNDAGALVDVPNGQIVLGDNQDKLNMWYTHLAVDLAKVAGYLYGEFNNTRFDLASLNAGRGSQTPQTSSPFSGGLNFSIDMTNRNQADNGRAWVIVDRARAWVEA